MAHPPPPPLSELISLRSYLTSLVAFVLLDSVWLGLVAPSFYRAQIGHLMSDQPDFKAATLFYLIFLLGLQIFILGPYREAPLKSIALPAFAFGVITYATFDLTSVAVLKGFPYRAAVVDMMWGGLLSMGVCLATAWFSAKR